MNIFAANEYLTGLLIEKYQDELTPENREALEEYVKSVAEKTSKIMGC